MNQFDLNTLIRPNIRSLVPYSAARHEYTGSASLFLDANESSVSPFSNLNRYPDPLQVKLKNRICELKRVSVDQVFLGNGSDEAIDLLLRSFCEPGRDNIVVFPPTYGMYEVSAAINNVEVRQVLLTSDFQLDRDATQNVIDENTRLLFICSPNNPTGNLINPESITKLLRSFKGLVVIDEAYIDFAGILSWNQKLSQFPNLVVLQTFSKAWGLAGLRLGMAFASKDIVEVLNKVKPPYNISTAAQSLGLRAVESIQPASEYIRLIKVQRPQIIQQLLLLPFITEVFPSDANFVLLRVSDAASLYAYLLTKGIVVRNRSALQLCENCLRVTLGTESQNQRLISALKSFSA